MKESENSMSARDIKDFDNTSVKVKPKKRSLLERELETKLTEKITSPVVSDSANMSRYGRARHINTASESIDSQKVVKSLKSPQPEKSAMKSPVYKMHASNSPIRVESPNKATERSLDPQIEIIYNENISLSRFGEDKKNTSPIKQPKVYVRKDLIQIKEKEDSLIVSPVKSSRKYKNNAYLGNSSVDKRLDFDRNKKKNKNNKPSSKSDLFDLEAKCEYQVGDLAWARMGSYPYWPCIVTRDPYSRMFVKKKLFGKVNRDVIHVTFFGDNGRRSWTVDSMLRKFLGKLEFELAREKLTPEERKKDPNCAAFFVSEKKLPQWTVSVEEAETLLRKPKRLRIDLLNDMLKKTRTVKTYPKRRNIGRAGSLSESLYDTLFSEENANSTETANFKTSTRKKSLDVSEVVTACLDDIAAKTGMTKIKEQSHMDRWLQKAKSKTPEKSQLISQKNNPPTLSKKKNKKAKKDSGLNKLFHFTTSDNKSLGKVENKLESHQKQHDYSSQCSPDDCLVINSEIPGFITTKVESLSACNDSDLSNDIDESELIMSDDYVIAEEHVVECDQANGTNDVVIKNIKTLQDDTVSIKTICSTISKNFEDHCAVSASDSNNEHLSDSDKSKANFCAIEETIMDVRSGNEKNIHSVSESQSPIINGHGKETECSNDVYSDNQKAINDKFFKEIPIEVINNSSNKLITKICNDVTNEDDLGNRNVNIETKILSDKLVGNNVDSNKTDFVNENGMSVDEILTLNDDSDLTISESMGLENKRRKFNENNLMNDVKTLNTIDNEKFSGNSELIKNCYNIGSSQNVTDKHVYNNESSFNIDHPLVSSVHNICSDILYGDNAQPITNRKEGELCDDSVTSNKLKCTITSDILTNGNIIETDSTFGDDESSSNSSPHSLERSSVKKRKKENRLRLIRKVYKSFGNAKNKSIKINKSIHREKEYIKDKTLNNKNLLKDFEITLDDTSSQSTEESEHCSTESCETFDSETKDQVLINIIEQITEESGPCSTKSKTAYYLDNRSLHSNQRSESVETIGSMDVDESTCDTDTQNFYNKPNKKEDEYIDRNINKERVIIDQLRLTPNGFEIIKDNCMKNTAENQSQEEKDSGTVSIIRNQSEALLQFDAVTQNFDTESSKNNIDRNEPMEIEPTVNKSMSPIDISKEKNIFNSDELGLTTRDLGISQENETQKDETSTVNVNEEDETTKNFHTESSKNNFDRNKPMEIEPVVNKSTSSIDISKEKSILNGDELRLTPRDLGISQENETQKGETPSVKVKEEDSATQNFHTEPSKNNIDRNKSKEIESIVNKSMSSIDISKEKSILNGDELRLTPRDLGISQENETQKAETPSVKVKEEDSATQNFHTEPSKNNIGQNEPMEIEPIVSKSTSSIDISKEKSVLNSDELRLTTRDLGISQEKETQKGETPSVKVNEEDTVSVISTDSEVALSKRKMRWKSEKKSIPDKKTSKNMEDPDFLKYLELKQDEIYDENPDFSQEEITIYLYKTWLYEQSLKTDSKKFVDIECEKMVKGLQTEAITQPKEVKKRNKVKKEKDCESFKEEIIPKKKPKRNTVRPSYYEEYSDIESDLEVFTVFKPKRKEIQVITKTEDGMDETGDQRQTTEVVEIIEEVIDEVEKYFAQLVEPKPNVFKGLLRERVCDICEKTGNLVKCKGCTCMFHVSCVKKETEVVEVQAPVKGRKKKKKYKGRKSKSDENGLDESHSDEKDGNIAEENANTSTDNIEPESHIVADADEFEAKLSIKMKEFLGEDENVRYDSFSSDDELDWSDIEAGKCEIVDIKLRKKIKQELIDYSDFKCNNCHKYDVPICFVCRSAESPKKRALHRQKCQVPQCNTYYHLECLEHWPQTQFNSGESAKYNKKVNEYFESLTCPRHVCHTCISDDPRGCKTRFSGDKLAKCVRCPATYHSFTKCLPAGSKILTGSHIICPRHYEHRPGKIPCHVNTGWCFICALGGTLICCEYCPTSFHAECLNIKPPEGSYMCEDCETGRLPLYGEMVWVKLGHYRWWPGIILHPCEIPENILAVKHSLGEFVVRFFGQYDHYWVNRGRVFPFQEGDSGKVSSQKSKIDAAFSMAMEHAIRACEILKNATVNEEESLDIASSLLPPHYVKLRTNKPYGALCSRRVEPQESSLTQCECSPSDEQPCGPYSHCLNRMLLTECGPTCRAGDRCNNRAFEKRQYPKLVPYRTPQRGWGLKTLEDIKAGQFVIEYVGELIDEEEFQRRMCKKHAIRDENFYFLTLDKERMIDAGPKGNLARFMNHCCEPNCETQKWTVLGDIRVGLFALYDIPANSEVTFNYNLESAGIQKKRCLCGAKRCSGYIGAKPKQLQTQQQKKGKQTAKRTYKKRKVEESPTTSQIKPKP